MSIQGNFNSGLFGNAMLVSSMNNSRELNSLGNKVDNLNTTLNTVLSENLSKPTKLECLSARVEEIELQIAIAKANGATPENLEMLLTLYNRCYKEYEEECNAQVKELKKQYFAGINSGIRAADQEHDFEILKLLQKQRDIMSRCWDSGTELEKDEEYIKIEKQIEAVYDKRAELLREQRRQENKALLLMVLASIALIIFIATLGTCMG